MKFSIFTGEKILCILHGQVFIMAKTFTVLHVYIDLTFLIWLASKDY